MNIIWLITLGGAKSTTGSRNCNLERS